MDNVQQVAADSIRAIEMVAKAAIGAIRDAADATNPMPSQDAPSTLTPIARMAGGSLGAVAIDKFEPATEATQAAATDEPADQASADAPETDAPSDETEGDEDETDEAPDPTADLAQLSPNDRVRAMTGGAPPPAPPAGGPNAKIAAMAASGTHEPGKAELEAAAAQDEATTEGADPAAVGETTAS